MTAFDDLFETFKHQYQLTNPMPETRRIFGIGWDFWLSLFWAITSVLMVASQTSSEFYQSKVLSGMDTNLAISAAFMVIFAVDGGLVIGAAIKSAKKRDYSENLVQFAIILCIVISIAAGVNSTIGIVPNISGEFVYYARMGLLVALGFCGSLLAWTSGDILGSRIANVLNRREEALKDHQKELEEYNQRMLASWKASPAYVVAMSDIRTQAESVKSKQKVSENFLKVSDYRKLPVEEKQKILDMTTSEVQELYGLANERTAYNWRQWAERDFAGENTNGKTNRT